ncbi:MAG TPA: hypothetical protein VKN18_27275 [Blastocatellia bacterium]|nr:hypothetical protein [Blastocatellia bacterium]
MDWRTGQTCMAILTAFALVIVMMVSLSHRTALGAIETKNIAPLNTKKIDEVLGRSGELRGDAVKVARGLRAALEKTNSAL